MQIVKYRRVLRSEGSEWGAWKRYGEVWSEDELGCTTEHLKDFSLETVVRYVVEDAEDGVTSQYTLVGYADGQHVPSRIMADGEILSTVGSGRL